MKACDQTADKEHCDTFHADDEEYFEQIWYWTTPIAQCLDGRTDVEVQGLRAPGPRPGPRSRAEPLTAARRLALRLHRHPRVRLAALLLGAAAVAGGRLPRLAGGAARHVAVDRQTRSPARSCATGRWRTSGPARPSEVYRNVALRSLGGRRRGDGDRRGDRAADGVLHGQGGLARGAQRIAGHRDPHAAVGELPGQGVRLAGHAGQRRPGRLAARRVGRGTPGYGLTATVAGAGVPVAAVHDPADLRRAGPAAGLAAGGLGRPRRPRRAHVPRGGAADARPGGRRRLDLHVLAVAGRLHHRQIVGGKTQLIGNLVYANIGAANNLPFAAALATIPVLVMVIYLAAVRRTGALEELMSLSARPRAGCCAARWRSAWRSSTCRWSWCWSTRSTPTGRSPGRRPA